MSFAEAAYIVLSDSKEASHATLILNATLMAITRLGFYLHP